MRPTAAIAAVLCVIAAIACGVDRTTHIVVTRVVTPSPTATQVKRDLKPTNTRVQRDRYPTLSAACQRYWRLAREANAGPNASDRAVSRFHQILARETGDTAGTWNRFRASCWLSGR